MLYPENHSMGPFLLCHEPMEEAPTDSYVLCGHLHPGIRLVGKGRQSLRLPCFQFGPYQGILPAFGQFTGLAMIEPEEKDQIFAIAEDQVLPIR